MTPTNRGMHPATRFTAQQTTTGSKKKKKEKKLSVHLELDSRHPDHKTVARNAQQDGERVEDDREHVHVAFFTRLGRRDADGGVEVEKRRWITGKHLGTSGRDKRCVLGVGGVVLLDNSFLLIASFELVATHKGARDFE